MNNKLTDIILAWYQMKGTCKELQKNIESAFDLTEKKPREFWIIETMNETVYPNYTVPLHGNLVCAENQKIIHVKEVL